MPAVQLLHKTGTANMKVSGEWSSSEFGLAQPNLEEACRDHENK